MVNCSSLLSSQWRRKLWAVSGFPASGNNGKSGSKDRTGKHNRELGLWLKTSSFQLRMVNMQTLANSYECTAGMNNPFTNISTQIHLHPQGSVGFVVVVVVFALSLFSDLQEWIKWLDLLSDHYCFKMFSFQVSETLPIDNNKKWKCFVYCQINNRLINIYSQSKPTETKSKLPMRNIKNSPTWSKQAKGIRRLIKV